MMCDPVKNSSREIFIVKDLDPIREREIRSNECTRSLVPGGQELEQ